MWRIPVELRPMQMAENYQVATLIYSPEKSRDLDSYLRAVFSNTPANFKAQYANYPPVLQKFDVLRSILTGMKFKLPQ